MVTAESILQFFEDELGIETGDIQPDTLLFSDGVVDSFALVSLMLFLEGQANFRIDPSDVNLDNFDSIERMLAYIARQTA
jgi:acyl carrier protein